MTRTEMMPSICRVCHNHCSVMIEVADGRAVRLTGDRDSAMSQGYSCVKGRALPEMLNSPDRVLHPLRKEATGFTPVTMSQALDDVAAKLRVIVDRHGSRSVLIYVGTHAGIGSPTTLPMMQAFRAALGTQQCTTVTIDQPGKVLGKALHGSWMAPPHGLGHADALLVIGMNPLTSCSAMPTAHPGHWLADAQDRNVAIVVIDPRRTEFARRATLHIQPLPGEDSALLAVLIRLVLEAGFHDAPFLREHVTGLEALRSVVGAFDPHDVAHRAAVDVDDLHRAAHIIGTARYPWISAGTGPNMAHSSTLLEYLILTLQTLRGAWPRAGDRLGNPGVLTPTVPAFAQAQAPRSFKGRHELHARPFTASIAGLPTALVADEILREGDGQIRALLSVGGNPVASWPDQGRVVKALAALDLLVQVDPFMSQTAAAAHYVIPPTMCLETPMTSQFSADLLLTIGTNAQHNDAWGQYAPTVVDPPPGSDVIDEWEFFYGLAQRLGLPLRLTPVIAGDVASFEIDMSTPPTSDDLIDMLSNGSRIPLDEVRQHPHGELYPDPPSYVQPKQEGWTGKLDIANEHMMADLAELAMHIRTEQDWDEFPFRLITRRMMNVYNSSGNLASTNRGRHYNPAFMNPADIERLGLIVGDAVEIASVTATIVGIVETDASVHERCISMTHNYGRLDTDDPAEAGANTNRLIGIDVGFEKYSGQPRMGNIPVAVRRQAVQPG